MSRCPNWRGDFALSKRQNTMRQLAYLGVAALTAVALLGTSCSDDATSGGGGDVGGATSVGGQNTGGATNASTQATGGATSASTSAKTGQGGANVGGVTGQGGANVGGVTGQGGAATGGGSSIPVTGGLELTGDDGNYLKIDNFEGVVWLAWDGKDLANPVATYTYSDIALTEGELCVQGTAQKVPNKEGTTTPDYSAVWGAEVGWSINQPKDADGGTGDPQPADVSDFASITLDFDGTGTTLPMRIQVEVPDPDGGTSKTYCAPIGLGSLPVTIPLTSLKTNCWSGGSPQDPFDPLTMKPSNVQIQVWTNTTKANPFNFCVTDLKFNKDDDAG